MWATTPSTGLPPALAPAFTIGGIIRWSLFLGVIGCVAIGMTARTLWKKTDKLVEQALLSQIQERVPDWDLTFESARADWNGKVLVKNVVLNGSDHLPLVEIPRLILELDMDLLLQSQKILVKRARIQEPLVRLRCYDLTCIKQIASWNCELPAPRYSETAPPDVVIEDAAVLMQLAGGPDTTPTEFRAYGVCATAVPDSRHGYSARMLGTVQHLGRIELTARTDFVHGGCHVKGRCGDLDLQNILQTVMGISPSTRVNVAALSAMSDAARKKREVQLTSNSESVLDEAVLDTPTSGDPLTNLGLQMDLNIDFEAGRQHRDMPFTYSVVAEVRDGQMTNPNLPVPLYGLKGHVAANQDGLVIRNLSAANGESRLNLDGHWEFGDNAPERRFTCQATELHIGPELRSYLPPPLQEKYDQLRPTGKFKVDVEYNSAFEGIPVRLRELSVIDGSVQHELFPYLVTGIRGGVTQDGTRFDLGFKGHANGREVLLTGSLGDITPEADLRLNLHVNQLPIDTELLRAFAESAQPALNKIHPVLASLNASGLADWKIDLHRPAGPNRKFQLKSARGTITHGALNYERFPYYLSDVTGVVEFNRDVEEKWFFKDLHGIHQAYDGRTRVTGEGFFDQQPAPGELLLTFTALDVPLDLDLQNASVKAHSALQAAWEELAPSGHVDLAGIRIGWRPGEKVDLRLPSIQLKNVRIRPKHLQYSWSQLNGAAAWENDMVIVRALQAYHDQTYLNINGVDTSGLDDRPLAYFQILPGPRLAWKLHLQDVEVRKLLIDDELRSALPVSVRNVVAHASPTQPFDLKLGIDMKGAGDSDTITAHWTSTATIHGGDLNMGIPLQNVRGTIQLTNGIFDGKNVEAVGAVSFDQVTIQSFPFTQLRSPFRISGPQIVVGSPSWVRQPPTAVQSPLAGQPLRAAAYGGNIALDAEARIDPDDSERSNYAVQLQVNNVKLQEIARANQWQYRLQGDIRGDVTLKGTGSDASRMTGGGWVQIQPAKLLDLPVLVKIFELIKFQPPDNFAFNSANGEFRVHDGFVDFTQIAFDGSTLGLVGQGTVGFINKSLNMMFFSRLKNGTPIVGRVLEVLGRNWVAISVLGTTEMPIVRTQPQFPIVGDAIKGVMQAMDRGQEFRPSNQTINR